MKNPFKLLFALLLVVTSLKVEAQRGPGEGRMSAEERANQQTEQMSQVLSLSEKQLEKVGEINLKYAEKISATRKENINGDRTAMREKMIQIRSNQDADLKTVMTSEQFEQWQKLLEEKRAQRGDKRKRKKAEDSKGR